MQSRIASVLVSSVLLACGSHGATEVGSLTHPPVVAPQAEVEVPSQAMAGRLPTSTRPLAYHLALEIDPRDEGFSGAVEIDVDITEETQIVPIHGEGLTVQSIEVTSLSGEAPTVVAARWVDSRDAEIPSHIELERPVSGRARISLVYSAPFSTDLQGMYVVETGGERYVFTQMEPLAARRAFPCFDEPAFKAEVNLRVKAPEGFTVAANAPFTEVDGEGYQNFAATPPTSTYLFAMVVGRFDVVVGEAVPASPLRPNPLPLRAIAPRGQGGKLAFALQHTGEIVSGLENYFGIAYPYAKLDIVAVPDFEAGAMENPGLVTFRDSILLLEGEPTPAQKRYFDEIMAHELSHQWFGNLVTMQWWDDLWLNEAFASWMEFRAIASLRPESEPELSALAWSQATMDDDVLRSARSIQNPIENIGDIHNAFDGITYGKGQAVLRMFERFVGPERFQTAVRSYLAAHRGSNATGNDFLAALDAAAGLARPPSEAFRTFLSQPGVPELTMTLDCTGETPALRVAQHPFVAVGAATAEASDARVWQVPVCVRFGAALPPRHVHRGRLASDPAAESQELCFVVDAPEVSVPLSDAARCPAWFHPNADAAGYYRVAVSEEAMENLSRALPHLNVSERMAALNALASGIESGSVPVGTALEQALLFVRDPHYRVAARAIDLLTTLDEIVSEADRSLLQERMRTALARDYRTLGWRTTAQDSELTRFRRRSLVPTYVDLAASERGSADAIALGSEAFLGTAPSDVDEELILEAVALASESEGDVRRLWDRALASLDETDPRKRERVLRVLFGTTNPAKVEEVLQLAASGRLRVNETIEALEAFGAQEETSPTVVAFLRQHFAELAGHIPPSTVGYLPIAVAYCDEGMRSTLDEIFTPHLATVDGLERNLALAHEGLAICLARRERYQTALGRALHER